MASVYDLRMQEIAAERAAKREAQADRGGLNRIEESTQTINTGISDPINWVLCIASIVGIPFSGGLSVGLAVIALLRATKGGRAYAQAIPPTRADLAAPGPGCVRILGALGSLVILVIIILLFGAAVAYNAGVKP